MTIENATERRTRRVLIGLFVVVVCCGVGSAIFNLGDGSGDLQSVATEQVYDQPVDHVELDIIEGSVTVETAVDNRVAVSYREHYFSVQPQPQHRVTDQALSVWFGGCGGATCWIDYTIRVPESTTLDISVEVGDISVDGVSASQELTTGDGDIISTGAGPVTGRSQTGNIDLHDVNGDVDVRAGSGNIELSQVSGNVVAAGNDGDVIGIALQSATVEVTAGYGEVDLTFEDAPQQVTVGADSGDAIVRVPDDGELYRVTANVADEPAEVAIATSATSERVIELTIDGGSCEVSYR